jgi:hypothetical protein
MEYPAFCHSERSEEPMQFASSAEAAGQNAEILRGKERHSG